MKKLISLVVLVYIISFVTGCEESDSSSNSKSNSSSVETMELSDSSDESETTETSTEMPQTVSSEETTDEDTMKIITEEQTTEPDHKGESQLPYSSDEMIGKSYDDLTGELEESGFTNIRYDIIDDLIIGLLKSDGEVEEVSINGETEFSEGDWVLSDAEIVISYHTFPSSDEAETTESDETENTESDEADTEEVLTIDNCPDLANILTMTASSDPAYESFAEKYEGRIIEFDGRIDYITNHGNYNTRYDILVSFGDYIPKDQFGPTYQYGPTFKLENIGTDSFSSVSSDYLRIGDNIHISAKVGRCDSFHELFYLESPVITDRS